MAIFTITGANSLLSTNAVPALTNAEASNTLFVSATGSILSSGTADAVSFTNATLNSNHIIHVNGDVWSRTGIGLNLSSKAAIVVGSGGYIYGSTGIFVDDSLNLTNAGLISGITALTVDAVASTILNSGSILVTGTTAPAIVYSGTGLQSTHTLVNSGTISARAGLAIQFDITATDFELLNSGTIRGGIALNGGAGSNVDTVINSGTIIGNVSLGAGNDVYDARGGGTATSVDMGSGQDRYFGSEARDIVVTEAGNDTYELGGGADVYRAVALLGIDVDGDDTIDGGDGTDTYRAEFQSNTSFVIDLEAGLVTSTSNGSDTLISFENASGGFGNDTLRGDDLFNVLQGSSGNDHLDGRGGRDILMGGAGNDTFVVDVFNDRIIEDVDGDTDRVQSSVTYNLANATNVEVLTLTGNANINAIGTGASESLFGNVGNNSIFGSAGVDNIAGSAGNDTLSGGIGNDLFVFNSTLDAATNVDTITDFVAADDTIRLENTGTGLFTGLANGNLSAAAFRANAAGTAADADDRILYNTATGDLFFDADGNGGGAAIKFANLSTKPTITQLDFFVI